ncbi:MAG: DUF971 domain-containing protein [Hyphomicrobiaceae bacterium]
MATDNRPWPSELKLDRARSELTVTFDDGQRFVIPAEMLRVMSPSAEVQGHSPEQRVTVAGKRNVRITDLVPVGNYAVQIVFDDGHDSGFFRYEYLYELGEHRETHWLVYLDELARKGLTRG